MMQRDWISSEVLQPENGQPVWVYHSLDVKDIYGVRHVPGVYKSAFHWDSNIQADYPFWWRIHNMGALYGDRLWMSRWNNEKPEPPAEKPKVEWFWFDSKVQLPHRNQKVLLSVADKEMKAIFLWVANGDYPLWKAAEETLADGQLMAAHMKWRPDPEAEKPKAT